MESTNTAKTETEVKASVEPTAAIASAVPTSSTIKKVAFWGGIGVCALAIGAGLAYWLKTRDSSVSEQAGNTAEALRR